MTDEIKTEAELREAQEKDVLKRKRAGQGQEAGEPGLGGRGGDANDGAQGGQRS